MKTVLLCGGYATRLGDIAKNFPKALLPVSDKKVLDYTFEKIKDFNEIFLVSNSTFCNLFLEWSKGKENVNVLNDGVNNNEERLGAVGDLSFVAEKEKIDEDILLILGDNLFDFNIEEFVKQSENKEKSSIGVYKLEKDDARKFGVVEVLNEKVKTFEEKPENPKSDLISIGIYYIKKKDIYLLKEYLKSENSKDSIGKFFKFLLENSGLNAYSLEGKWFDIGTPEIYDLVKKEWR